MNRINRWSKGARFFLLLLLPTLLHVSLWAGAGKDGSAFLLIPTGAKSAAMGSAYSALATDSYATTWNPAGLSETKSLEASAQHLEYIEEVRYEHASLVQPISEKGGWGIAMQYLTSGNIPGTNAIGDPTGDFSNSYAAYSVAYGHKVTDRLSAGMTGKWIHARLDTVSASTYGADFGALFQWTEEIRLALTLTNIGGKLKFLNEGDSLPTAGHAAFLYEPKANLQFSAEGVYQSHLASGRVGINIPALSHLHLRAGYRTDILKENSPLAGVTVGIGIPFDRFELSYAWVPLGDLGFTQYLSVIGRFGSPRSKSFQTERAQARSDYQSARQTYWDEKESSELYQLLSQEQVHPTKKEKR